MVNINLNIPEDAEIFLETPIHYLFDREVPWLN